jgi:hypothetical protein
MAVRGRRIGAGLAAVLVSAAGVAGGVPQPASAAAPNVVSHVTKKAHALPAPGMQRIESIRLTKGTWTLVAKASAFGGEGAPDFFRCQLVDMTHKVALDGSTAQLGAGLDTDVITNLALLKAKGPVTIAQECGHDGTAGNAGSIEADASLVGFVVSPSRVRVARTTAQTPIGSGGYVGVLNLSLPKGSWVLGVKLSAVGFDAVRGAVDCTVDNETLFTREVGTVTGMHAVSTLFHVAAATPSTTSTLTLSCRGNDPQLYLDPNTAFWAWKATNLQQASGLATCPVTLQGAAAADALVEGANLCRLGSGNFPTQIAGAHLRAGTWVALSGVDGLASEGNGNLDHCELLDASHGRALDVASAAESAENESTDTQITNLAVTTVKHGLAVEGRCGEDLTESSPGQVESSGWAFIKP